MIRGNFFVLSFFLFSFGDVLRRSFLQWERRGSSNRTYVPKKNREVKDGLQRLPTVSAISLFSLKYMEVLAVLELAVLLAEEPGQHLPGLHTGAHYASGFVPMTAALAAATAVSVVQLTLDYLQADLVQYADQEVVHVVADAHRHLDELGAVRAGQAFPVCNARFDKAR